MRIRIRKLTSLLLSLSLLSALTLPAAASAAMGEDLTAKDTLIHRETQLSTNVFWSEAYSDLRTENLITYTPNQAVTPIVTYGDVLTDRSSVADMAAALEAEGYRVVAGINGDFYNVNTGLPIGLVVTDGVLRSSDAGYYAIGFRADGTAILGKPSIRVSADLGYTVDDGFGTSTEVVRPVAAVNKARTNSGIFLYTYDFNAKHTTGTTEAGVNVVCAIEEGSLTIGGTVTARVERVEESTVTALQPGEIVLSANSQADTYYSAALRNMQPGSTVTLSVTAADEGWNDVKYAVGALYCLAENGVVASGLAAGTNPRTAVGQKADGTLVFYTVDGRRSGHSIGASMTQVGERLLELGCQTVLCLDGGGSTNLAVTTPDSTTATIINRPSETGRKVTNQVFLVASDRASGDLDHFYVHAASDYVLAGSSVYVTATGVDSSFIPMPVPNYTLTASAGTLENDVLTTPAGGGDITVTASGRGASGSTVVHAISTPDSITLKNGTSNLTTLTVTPGSKTTLTAGAIWNHLTLGADAKAFTWSVNVGTVDENGVFSATTPGTGSLTVSAGDKSLTIPVTVAQAALQTIEDFETPDTRFFSGYYLTVSRTNVSDHVQRGHYAGKLDYVLPEDTGFYSQAMAGSFSNLGTPYTALNLWVYGDGSGNQLSFLYTGDVKSDLELPVTTLDFTGWKQINVPLPQYFTLSGVVIYAPSTTDATWDHIQVTYADTPRTGTVYIDQITAAFPGTVDNAPPVVTATLLDQQNWAVDIKVSDGVDGILPLSSITVARNGDTGQVLEGYDTATGTMKYYLPGPGETTEVTRVTVTAVDASGNIGRASVDIPPYGVSHKFTDIDDYWAADYVDFLYNADITTGYSDGTFRPNQNISRAQFAVMLYRYLKLDANKYESVSLPFADLGQIPAYALPAAKALYSEGIITGSEKNGKLYFNPDSSLTRAQAAAMIGRTQAKGYAEAELTFTDNGKIPAYAAPYIRTMTAQGVISGYSDGSFKPNNNITRGQMAKILYNLM